jgi:hypothetical protein
MMARAQSGSAGQGKKIDTIYFDVDSFNNAELTDTEAPVRKVVIDIFMEKKFSGEVPPLATTSIIFTARCADPPMKREGTDLEVIIAAIRSDLDKHFAIEWENWFIVTVEKVIGYEVAGSGGLRLEWKDVQRGVTVDGEILMRRYNRRPQWNYRWEILRWPDEIKEGNRVVACIPATDENRKALEKFRDNIDELRKRLASFVAPDKIKTTLMAISAGIPLISTTHGADEDGIGG